MFFFYQNFIISIYVVLSGTSLYSLLGSYTGTTSEHSLIQNFVPTVFVIMRLHCNNNNENYNNKIIIMLH